MDFTAELVDQSQQETYECPVCFQLLRDPRITRCCKKNFCRACVSKIRGGDINSCPFCRHPNFITQKNVLLTGEVYKLQVYCANKSKGCHWTGCLGETETHLNIKPRTRYLSYGCPCTLVQCQFCIEDFQRDGLDDHIRQCPKRPFCCEYCQNYASHYEDVSSNHWPVCEFYPLPCPNSCGENIARQCMKHHVSNDCLMTVVECEFKEFGCKERLPRGEMLTHTKNSTAAHESLKMMTRLVKQLKKNDKELRQLEAKLHDKHRNLVKEQKDHFQKNLFRATDELKDEFKQAQQEREECDDRRLANNIKELKVYLNRRLADNSSALQRIQQAVNALKDSCTKHEVQISDLTRKTSHQEGMIETLNHRLRILERNYTTRMHTVYRYPDHHELTMYASGRRNHDRTCEIESWCCCLLLLIGVILFNSLACFIV